MCELGRLNCTSRRCEELNQCPGSLVYSPRSCLLSCSSLDPPGPQQGGPARPGCLEPLAGCVCPQGAVLLVGLLTMNSSWLILASSASGGGQDTRDVTHRPIRAAQGSNSHQSESTVC